MGRDPWGKRCPIGSVPLTHSPPRTEEPPTLQTPPDCGAAAEPPHAKEEASSSVQKPLLLLCLPFMLLPFLLPNYHPVELHSCWDLHLQTPAPQVVPQPHTTGVNGAGGSATLPGSAPALPRGGLLERHLHLPGIVPERGIN